MNQTPRAYGPLRSPARRRRALGKPGLVRQASALTLSAVLLLAACSTNTADTVEAIQTNDGAVAVKPPDVLAGETDSSSGDVAIATTAPLEPADDTGNTVAAGTGAESSDAERADGDVTSEASSESEFLPIPPNEFVWFDGSPGSTDDFAGTPTVLNFWSSNCAACVAEMPEFEEVAREVAGRVNFVGMNRDDTRDFALQLAEETGVTYPLAEDIDSKMFISFRAFAMPTTVFLNEANEVTFVWQGVLTGEELLILIDKHLQPGNL